MPEPESQSVDLLAGIAAADVLAAHKLYLAAIGESDPEDFNRALTMEAAAVWIARNIAASGGQLRLAKGTDIASAATLTIPTAGNYFDVTGTTTVTAIATVGVGTVIRLHFDGALTLTHHASDLFLPTGANIVTAAGDEAVFIEYATGDWRCVGYQRASGEALVGSGLDESAVNALIAAAVASFLENVVEDTSPQLGGPLDANGHQIREAKGADIASAATLAVTADGNYFTVTGTTTVTALADVAVGLQVELRFAAALTLTHHATDLILPTGESIVTEAGDTARFRQYAAGDWVCTQYQRASGMALAAVVDPGGLANVVDDTAPQLGGPLDANGQQIQEAVGADIASASTLAITEDGNYFVVTGTTTVTALADVAIGLEVELRFAAALTLTHNATDLILPTGENIVTEAGDTARFRQYAAGDWVCTRYQRASGAALSAPAGALPVPSATRAINNTSDGIDHDDHTKMLLLSASSTNATLNLRNQAGSVTDGHPWQALAYFWVRCVSTAGGTATVAPNFGITLYGPGGATGSLALEQGGLYFFYRASEDVWYVLATNTSPRDLVPKIVAQTYTSGGQALTTTYADVAGSSITYTPKFASSVIVYEFSFSLKGTTTAAGGIAHFTAYVAGSEQTAQRRTHRTPTNTSDQQVTIRFPFTNTTAAAKVFKLQAREFSGSFECVLHETFHWDGSPASNAVAALLTITEYPT